MPLSARPWVPIALAAASLGAWWYLREPEPVVVKAQAAALGTVEEIVANSVIDGVFEPAKDAGDVPEFVRFRPAAEPTPGALAAIAEQVRVRVLRWFARSGLIEPGDVREMLAWDNSGFSPPPPRSPHPLPPRPRTLAPRRAISGPCCWRGCSGPSRSPAPAAARTCASSPLSPRPRPSSGSSPTSVSHHARRQSPPPADHPVGTMLPSRCRTGTSSASPSPTSSLTSALPGSRRLSAVGDGAAALVFRRLAAPQILAPATRNGRACTARDVRQPHCGVLTAHPVRASVPSRANLDAQGGLDFLSVIRIRYPLSVRQGITWPDNGAHHRDKGTANRLSAKGVTSRPPYKTMPR